MNVISYPLYVTREFFFRSLRRRNISQRFPFTYMTRELSKKFVHETGSGSPIPPQWLEVLNPLSLKTALPPVI